MSADPNRKEKAPTLSLPKRNQSRRNPFLFDTSSIEEEPIGVNYSTIENSINNQRRQRKATQEERQRKAAEEEKYRKNVLAFERLLAFEKSKANRIKRQQQEQAQAKMEYNRRIRLGIEQPRYSGNNSGKAGGKHKTKRRHCRTKSRKRSSI
jgi:hypothetical protein